MLEVAHERDIDEHRRGRQTRQCAGKNHPVLRGDRADHSETGRQWLPRLWRG